MLAALALALKMMVPAGYMPGASLAAPILLCSGQGDMPGMTMAQDGQDRPGKASHDKAEHPCAFAGLGAASLTAPFEAPALAPVLAAMRHTAIAALPLLPGRGLAAPPPPSHAPPPFRL